MRLRSEPLLAVPEQGGIVKRVGGSPRLHPRRTMRAQFIVFVLLLSTQGSGSFGAQPACAAQAKLVGRSPLVGRFQVSALRGGKAEDEDVDPNVEARDKALIQQLQSMRSEASALAQRRAMLEQEVEDHYLVTETLSGFNGSRRCYRSVGGVLMESTVGEVAPAVTKELDMMAKALEELTTKLEECRRKMQEFQDKNAIRILRGQPDEYFPQEM